jgi:serine/threonine protein kinase
VIRCPACKVDTDETLGKCSSCGHDLLPLIDSPPPRTLNTGDTVGSRYVILGTLGRGGMGVVFKAKDRVLDETVALKVLRPDVAGSGEIARRFKAEIKLARKVRHRNVCGIFEFGEEAGMQYIAMELVQGIDIKQLLRQKGRLGAQEAFQISIQLAKGLEAIHDVGIIHRDLKTANAMIDDHGVVRLMDFGIAKKFDAEGSTGATAVGHIIGTPEYMSPEQARGEKIDFRSDLYALGIVIFEIFTGYVPFQAETPIATIFKHIQDPPPLDAAGLPEPLVAVLGTLLAKDPRDRYNNAGEVVEALRETYSQIFPESATLPLNEVDTHYLPELSVAAQATAVPRQPSTRPSGSVSRGTPPSRPGTPPSRPGTPRYGTAPHPKAGPGLGFLVWLLVVPVVGLVLVVGVALGVRHFLVLPSPEDSPSPSVLPLMATPMPGGGLTVPESPAIEPVVTPPGAATPIPAATPTPVPIVAETPVPVSRPSPRPVLPILPATPTPAARRHADPPEASGTLRIIVRPWADVMVDGKAVGTAPPLQPLSLKPGSHAIRLSHPDYRPLNRKVTISPGEEERLTVDLTLDALPK